VCSQGRSNSKSLFLPKMSLTRGGGFVNPDFARNCESVNAQQPMTEGATIFELNFKANLNYALKLNRTKPNKMKRTKINYLQKPTFCPPKMRCIFLLLRRQRAQFYDRPSKAAAVCFDSRDTDYAIGTGMDVFLDVRYAVTHECFPSMRG
jgi:hypothetical protein